MIFLKWSTYSYFFKLEKKQDFFTFQGVFFGPEFKWTVSVNPNLYFNKKVFLERFSYAMHPYVLKQLSDSVKYFSGSSQIVQ